MKSGVSSLKKICNQFLIITFLISYACFGALVYSRLVFSQLMEHPFYRILFILGCLGPVIAAVAVHMVHRESLGGIRGLWAKLIAVENPKSALLIVLFLAIHYGFGAVMGILGEFRGLGVFLKSFPIMLVLFGSQEIGWRVIVQTRYEADQGFWKSTIITGLMWAMWFLPLLLIPQFVVYPDFFMQFSACIVGMGMLQTTIYKQSGSILYGILSSTLFFSVLASTGLKHSNMVVAVAAVDVAITFACNSKLLNK